MLLGLRSEAEGINFHLEGGVDDEDRWQGERLEQEENTEQRRGGRGRSTEGLGDGYNVDERKWEEEQREQHSYGTGNGKEAAVHDGHCGNKYG